MQPTEPAWSTLLKTNRRTRQAAVSAKQPDLLSRRTACSRSLVHCGVILGKGHIYRLLPRQKDKHAPLLPCAPEVSFAFSKSRSGLEHLKSSGTVFQQDSVTRPVPCVLRRVTVAQRKPHPGGRGSCRQSRVLGALGRASPSHVCLASSLILVSNPCPLLLRQLCGRHVATRLGRVSTLPVFSLPRLNCLLCRSFLLQT